MRVFVTGASGFVGSAIVQELLKAGHEVLGLARTDSAAERLIKAGAAVHRGDLEDLESLKAGAAQADAVIHTAFNHDFTKFKANCESDRQVITSLGETLSGTNRPLVITSGIGLMNGAGKLIDENDVPPSSDIMARAASEEAARAVSQLGVNTYIVRLPPTTHGEGDHGFIPMVINMDKEKGESAYIGAGRNRWPAANRFDAATLYRLIIEQQPEQKVFHAVAEEGVPFIDIATAIGKGLSLPVVSKDEAGAGAHFGWFQHFASFDCPATSELTRKTLGWEPKHPGLLEDLVAGKYFS